MSHINRYRKATNGMGDPSYDWRFTWELGITGTGLWYYIEVEDPDRITQRTVSPHARLGATCGRIEVQTGDAPNGERAEVCLPQNGDTIWYEEPLGQEIYYATSVWFPVDYVHPAGADPWGIFVQLHGPDPLGGPDFCFYAMDTIYIQLYAGDYDVAGGDDCWHTYTFTSGRNDLANGHWVDFVWKIKFSKTTAGAIQVWRRDEGDQKFSSVLKLDGLITAIYSSTHPEYDNDHYWKTGWYRNAQGEALTNVLFLDCFARATSFDRVVNLAYGS